MDDDLKEIAHQLGVVTEAAGRMLKRKPPLTHDDLTMLRDTLKFSAMTIEHIRDTSLLRESQVS